MSRHGPPPPKGAVRRSSSPRGSPFARRALVDREQRLRPVGLERDAVEVLGRAPHRPGRDQLEDAGLGEHAEVVADVAEASRRASRSSRAGWSAAGRPSRAGSAGGSGARARRAGPGWSRRRLPCGGQYRANETFCLRRQRPQASSRTPPISLKTAVMPPSSRCSSAITWETALISARWVNACGKLPRWRPLGVSSSSAKRSSEPADSSSRSQSSRARVGLADLRERRDQPEGADQEGPLLAAEAVVGLLDPVAEDEAVLGQLVGDRLDRRAHARVVGGQEADAAGSAASRRRGRRCRSAGGRRRRGSRARGSRRLELLGGLLATRRRSRPGRPSAPAARRGRPRPRSSASRRRSAWARRATPRSPGRAWARRRSPPRPARGSARGRPGRRCRAALFRAGRSSRAARPRRRAGAGRRRRCRSAPGGRRRSRRGGRASSRSSSFSPPIPYMICRFGSSRQTSRMKRMKSRASWSKPSVCSAQRLKVESRIQL